VLSVLKKEEEYDIAED